ncbi:tetratricopeptide repeat protein, partial [Pseudomonas fluorescens]|uniref:tetratricopeptide repeat protein n=1 Tax=Pseudomonas fluorescens TaxID=294 RepID=UPI0006424BAE
SAKDICFIGAQPFCSCEVRISPDREVFFRVSLNEWLPDCGVGGGALTLQNAAEHYPQIFERRFEGDREAGYAELEAAMEGKSPSLGYSLLAEVIQHTRHKVVVTTNFDNLVADALAMHAHQSPLVVAHESLAGFVRPQLRRPLVAKIHRDLYLHPINDPAGVSTMEQGWKIALKKLFQYFTPVVVGYGGNDGSLMNMLMGLDRGDIAGRMIWCYREGSPPPEKALSVLEKHKGVLVKIPGFDQFMLQLAAKLVSDFDVAAIAERTAKLGQERAVRYRDQAEKLSESSVGGSLVEQRTGAILTQSVRSGQSWWAWDIQARAEPDLEKRKSIYLEGIKQFPNSPEIIGNYALFLNKKLFDFNEAEKMYNTALAIDSTNIPALGNYADFLAQMRGDLDTAEELYKKAFELDPTNITYTEAYASFLATERKDLDQAESIYKKALEIDPRNASLIGDFAGFLYEHREDLDAAEAAYKRALELDPSNAENAASYANFLAIHRNTPDVAEALFIKARDLDQSSAWNTCTYANFLNKIRKNYDAAETMFLRALELSPQSGWVAGSYAEFLADSKHDHDGAEEMYKRALAHDPKSVWACGIYARFLETHRKDYEAAEAAYEKAIALSPSNIWILGNFASFLERHRKNYKLTEDMYKRALTAEPSSEWIKAEYEAFLERLDKQSESV